MFSRLAVTHQIESRIYGRPPQISAGIFNQCCGILTAQQPHEDRRQHLRRWCGAPERVLQAREARWMARVGMTVPLQPADSAYTHMTVCGRDYYTNP